MAEKPVIVPVELQVTDLDMDSINLKDVQKNVSQKLSGLKKTISDLFAGVDTSKINKAISDSMTKVEKNINRAVDAQTRFDDAIIRAGRSSEVYKAKIAEIDSQLKSYQSQLNSFNEQHLDRVQDPEIQKYGEYLRKSIESLTKARAEINPANFVDTAAPEAVLKVAQAYRKVGTAIADVNKQEKEFNQTVDKNKLSDEYTQQAQKAEDLKTKLEQLNERSKKMAEVGATDKAWESLQYDTKQVSSELDSVLRKMREMVKEGEAFRFDAAEDDIKKLKAEIKSLNATRMAIAGNGKNKIGSVNARANASMTSYTADYQKQLAELQKLENEVTKLSDKYEKFKALGRLNDKSLAEMAYDAEHLQSEIDTTRESLTEMLDTGRAFRLGDGDSAAEISGITSRINEMANALTTITNNAREAENAGNSFMARWRETGSLADTLAQSSNRVVRTIGEILKTGSKVGTVLGKGFSVTAKGVALVASGLGRVASRLKDIIKNAAGAIKNLNIFHKSGAKTSDDLGKKFKKLERNILMFGFGFRSAYYAIKRLRTTFSNAFKTLATQSEEVNAQLSTLVMSLNRLKGSLATAFQPLATVVIPLLDLTMEKLSQTMEVIGKFFATLSGQNYIYKAVANQLDYADSLTKTGKAAEEAEKKLGSYDKLDVIQDNKDNDNTGSGNLLDVTYQKADVEGATSEFAKLLKEAWKNQDFTEVGEVVGDKILSIFDKAKSVFIPKITGFANKITQSITTFIDGFDITSIGKKLASLINTALSSLNANKIGQTLSRVYSLFWEFVDGLVNNINWEKVGTTLANFVTGFIEHLDINAIVNTIIGLLDGIGTALITFVDNINWEEVGTKFTDGIIGFIERVDLNKIAEGVSKLVNGIGTALLICISNIDFEEVATKLAEGINTFLSNIDGETFESGLSTLINGIITFAVKLIEKIDWTSIYEGLKNGIDGVLTSLEDALNNSDVPLLQMIGELIGAIHEAFTVLWPVVEKVVQALMPIIEAILPVISEILPPVASVVGQLVEMVLPVLVSLIKTFMPIIEQLVMIIMPILQDLLTALQPLFEVFTNDLLPVIEKLLNSIMPLIDGVLSLVTAILVPILNLLAPLLKLVAEILDPIVDLLAPIFDLVGSLFKSLSLILTPILNLLTPLLTILTTLLQPIFSILSLTFKLLTPFIDIIKLCANIVSAVLSPILNILVGVFDALAQAVQMMGDVFTAVFDTIENVFQKVWGTIKNVINSMLGGFEVLLNGVVSTVNKIISAVNGLSFDVPDWVPVIGGKKFGFNLKEISAISIPRLAQGAVIPPNKEFLAMLGDQKSGTNIEAPLDTIKQALMEVLTEWGKAGNHEPIILKLDGKVIAQVVWSEEEKRYKQTGKISAHA